MGAHVALRWHHAQLLLLLLLLLHLMLLSCRPDVLQLCPSESQGRHADQARWLWLHRVRQTQ